MGGEGKGKKGGKGREVKEEILAISEYGTASSQYRGLLC